VRQTQEVESARRALLHLLAIAMGKTTEPNQFRLFLSNF
jgi:hypothetical protein